MSEVKVLISKAYDELKACFDSSAIEEGAQLYYLAALGRHIEPIEYSHNAFEVSNLLSKLCYPTDLYAIILLLEQLLDDTDYKKKNGVVYTPDYIADFIVKNTCHGFNNSNTPLILDPSCGCGVFLVAAADFLYQKNKLNIDDIISSCIFGIDINAENCRRTMIALRMLSAKYNGNYKNVFLNIVCADSLKSDWCHLFGFETLHKFDYIIGNPPYVNPHDMDGEYIKFLKTSFATTSIGVTNIFYAFIEKSLEHIHEHGDISYIVPNNLLTIKAASGLRSLLQQRKCVQTILDFGANMVFSPVRTYNCILVLSGSRQQDLNYHTFKKTEDIPNSLSDIPYEKMPIAKLKAQGWNLVSGTTRRNIQKIEGQMISLKEFIHTGIATLKDDVYLVENDETGFYKIIDGERLYFEKPIVRPIYKIPDLKKANNIKDIERYIIFPYIYNDDGCMVIDEKYMKINFPNTHSYLEKQKNKLASREKGKCAVPVWYAYGRSQGLNWSGKKLLFPTFASSPRFSLVMDKNALFCNGYAVFENNQYDLDILQKILNSRLMKYYIENTSYQIEGGYYCYQKKYVENFSLPWFSEDDLKFIRNSSIDELDDYLWKKYDLE